MRILLVDDDENLMESLAERLIQQRYAVDIAIDGSSAETYVDLFDYDLIVLDLMLPDGDGIEFCRRFRQDGYANPLMILTAKESTAQKVKALDAGADDYVIKPFDFDELCARIRALLRREHQGLPTVLSLGPLRLDPSACETTYKDNPVRLTPKEFSMMELFLRHPHRVYSLGAIIDDLWSFEDPPGEDAVRTHIKGLRRKLKAAGAPKDLIKTVYGLGYRLNENTAGSEKADPSPELEVSGPPDAAISAQDQKRSKKRVDKQQTHKQQTQKQQTHQQHPDDRQANYQRSVPNQSSEQLVNSASVASISSLSPDLRVSAIDESAHQARLAEQLVQACRRYLSTASHQVSTLEKVAVALSDELSSDELAVDVRFSETASSELYAEGRVCAHKLAGSLGSFGIVDGSQLAKKIEIYLEERTEKDQQVDGMTEARVAQFTQWVTTLRSRIDQATVQAATDALSVSVQEGLPVVLIVSEDAVLATALAQCASRVGLQTQMVANTQQAIAVLDQAVCDLVLLDMPAVVTDDLMAFIEKTKQGYDLPIVALGAQITIAQRLGLIQQGIEIVTHRSALPLQVMTAAAGVIRAQVSEIRVAIADDDPDILALLQTSLESWGFQVTTFERAMHLWQWLADEPAVPNTGDKPVHFKAGIKTDILVLDIEMPEMSGLDLCQILRADARFQSIPILFLTHHQEEALRIQAYQLGADDFIHKAVAPTELATRLRNQLTRACFTSAR